MTCKKITIFFGMLFLVFCATFVSSPSTFALDYTVTETGNPTYFCNNNDANFPNCSDFNFAYIHNWSGFGGRFTFRCQFGQSDYFSFMGNNKSSFLLTDISSCDSLRPDGYSGWFSGTSFTLSLLEDNPFDPSISGTLSVTENGTFDVSTYQYVDVDVPAEVIQGDYHDDLLNINKSILTCGAVCLVIYFFYCIYRMIIKSAGGWGS